MKIGFIGLGNMNGAILKGIVKSEKFKLQDLLGADIDGKICEERKEELGLSIVENNVELAKKSDIIFLGVKPYLFEEVISEIKEDLKDDAIIVSITPVHDLTWLEEKLGFGRKIVWTIPNIPSSIGEGMTGIAVNEHLSEKDIEIMEEVFTSIGKVEFVSEDIMGALAATSSTTPAFIAMILEGMADGAVLEGIPRKLAYELVAQTMIGTGKMMLEDGIHPGEIKDQVCSPGGITIKGVKFLEEEGLRDLMMKMISICSPEK